MALSITPVEARIARLMQRLGREWGFLTPAVIERIAEASSDWDRSPGRAPADGIDEGHGPQMMGRR